MNPDFESHHFYQDKYGRVVEVVESYRLELEPYSVNKTLKLPVDAILDLYNDYHTLYQLTGETKFEARAKNYMNCLKHKLKQKEVS